MNWLEIIELRSVGSQRELLETQLKKLINEVGQEVKTQSVKVFCRNMIESDFSIHLFHDSRQIEVNGSSLGLQLVSSLKAFGLVNHSVWIEMQNR
jgi:hypothetical protein